MKNRTTILIKNTFILGLGQFLPKIVALITLPILTLALTTSEYGIYDLILTAEGIALPLMTLQVQQAIFRKLLQASKEKTDIIINSACTFLAILFAIWCPIIIGILFYVVKISFSTTLIIFFVYICASIYDVLGQTVRGLGYNFKYSIGIVIYASLNMIGLVVVYYLHQVSIINVFICSIISYICSCGYYLFAGKIYKHIQKIKIDKDIIKELLLYALPIIPSSVSLWIVNLSDRFFITIFLGTSLNGIYSVANKIPNLCASVYSVFNLAWTETAARVMDKDSDANEYYSTMFDVMFRFLSGAMLLLISFSPLLFRILINEQFDDAFQQMPLLFIGVFFNCIVSFYGGIYVAMQQTRQVGISAIVGALLNAIINVVFIQHLGLYAASLSTIISFAIIALYRGCEIRKYIAIKYNIVTIALCLFSLTIFCVLCSRRNTVLNFSMFVVALIWNTIFNRKIIFSIMRKLGIKVRLLY